MTYFGLRDQTNIDIRENIDTKNSRNILTGQFYSEFKNWQNKIVKQK